MTERASQRYWHRPSAEPRAQARLLFEFLAYTGLRIGEALGLTWADIEARAPLAPPRLRLAADRQGLSVVYVSRQLGTANPTVTPDTYANLFERADHAHTARDELEASCGGMLATSRPAAT